MITTKSGLQVCENSGVILGGLKEGLTVYDTLVQMEAVIVKVLSHNCVVLNNDYLGGLRHAWEISIHPSEFGEGNG